MCDLILQMVEGETSPPHPLQEADLIALMEKHGIGCYHSFLRAVILARRLCNIIESEYYSILNFVFTLLEC